MNTRFSISKGNKFESLAANRNNLDLSEKFNKQIVSGKTIKDTTQTDTSFEGNSCKDLQTLNNITNLSIRINTSLDKGTRKYRKLLVLK